METKQYEMDNFVLEPDFEAVVAKDAPAEQRRHRKEKGTETGVDVLIFVLFVDVLIQISDFYPQCLNVWYFCPAIEIGIGIIFRCARTSVHL